MGKEENVETRGCFCPYCDEEMIEVDSPYCQACRVTIFYCPACREPLSRDKKVCPHCGVEIQGKEGL